MNTLTGNIKRLGFYLLNSPGKIQVITFATYRCSCKFPISCYPAHTLEWNLNSYRSSHTFLSRVTADQLWKGCTSLSAAGRKKARGKQSSRKRIVDLNRGQVIGFGKKSMLWPGLNSPIIRGKEVVTQRELPPDETREKRIQGIRDQSNARFKKKLTPLERGWSGIKLPGRSLGPPDPIGEETFENFDSRVLEFRSVMTMSGQRGRIRSLSAFVVVGNKNGLAGFGLSKSQNGMTAATNAKNKAAQALRFIERCNGHTVLHDFHTQFGGSSIFVLKKPKGYGLICHRVIREICKMVGIKDLYAKCEGAVSNPKNITKAFFIGLMKQKLPEEIAEEKGLHLVEYRKENSNIPKVIASPRYCRKPEDIGIHEIMDFSLYCHQGRVKELRTVYKPFFADYPSHLLAEKYKERFRNRPKVIHQLTARYGELKSFLTIREEEKAKQEIKDAVESEK